MKKITSALENFLNKLGLGMRTKLIIIFLAVKIIPLILLTIMAWRQIAILGDTLKKIAVSDSSAALNASATENIERMSTDTAQSLADFLYARDDDIIYAASMEPTEENYRQFVDKKLGRLVKKGEWELAPDGKSWIPPIATTLTGNDLISSNSENNDMNGFHYRHSETFAYESVPLYDEITFIDLEGNEMLKYVTPSSTKVNYPMITEKKDVSIKDNTYVKAETYFEELKNLRPGELYVSDVIGAYVGSNYIGMYTPEILVEAEKERGYEIRYNPADQAYAGMENPNGQRFEGIVRWATPVLNDNGDIIGYVTLALNHDHIMEFVDHLTPMKDRYTELPSAGEGNYAFIWDYQCRSICHPRHHSIVGFDPETGDPQVPWLESSIYDAWQASGIQKWTDFIKDQPTFDAQSRDKKPAPSLTQEGLIGLDGRYLNNAPQCTGWMDLTQDGGSGSFYIRWSGLYKLTTAAAIPYYSGHYAPSEANGYSKRGFGFVAIGAGIDDFTLPAKVTEEKLGETVRAHLWNTSFRLIVTTVIIIVLVVFVAIWMASFLTNNITKLIKGVSRFRAGERQFRFDAPIKDEFGTLADSFDDMADNIVGSVNGPLCITDMNHKIIYMNDYGLEMCKKTLSEVVGTLYSESSVYPTNSEFCPITALEKGREAEVYYFEDRKQYIKGVANYFLGKNGKEIGYIIATTDVTEIQNARENAEQGNRAKSDFLSRMSHEIRTPLNAILGMIGIAMNTNDMGKIRHCLDRAENASKSLLGIINDVLDMSKIEADKFDLSYTEFNFEKMLMEITNVINFRAEEKHQNLVVNLDKDVPSFIIGDKLRLSQVMTNLLTNAVKFTPENGTIVLSIEKTDDLEGDVTLKVEVADNGIGISEEQKKRLFTSFEQADGSISRKFGGTGLGLAISKRIVELMGGRIWIESELGQGSKFIFTIKVKKGKEKIMTKLSEKISKNNIRILAVDDSAETRAYFSHIMATYGLTCDVADGSAEALTMIKNCGDKPYNIFFIDWQMPEMNGIELTKRIKDVIDNNSVVIMISVADWSSIEKEALTAGVNQFIPKPLFPSMLINVINECLGAEPKKAMTGAQVSTAQSPRRYDNHTILIAEDIEVNREIMATILDETGISIDFAENGTLAVSMFKEHPNKYSLIFMDIHMPEMDGYEATRRIRALDSVQAKDIPIIAMTANVFQEDINNCLSVGMNDHIGKPIDPVGLFAMFDRYLPQRTAAATKSVSDRTLQNEGTVHHDYAEFLPVINVTDGLNRLMNNKKIYFKLLKGFKDRQMVNELIKNINDGDNVKTAQVAHAIRGVASNLGLPEIVSVVSTIEAHAKAGIESHQMLDSLNHVVDEAVGAIINLLKEEL